MYKLLIIYVATFIQTTFCQYTEESEKNSIRMWLQPQIGISGSGFAGAIEIDAAYKAFMVGLRGESESELCIFCTKVD